MSIYENANFIQFPDGGIPSGLVPVKPEDNASNFDFARNSDASRVNKDKLIDEKSADEIRFDYTFASCPDILTEPQSTNLIAYSEDLAATASSGYWNNQDSTSVLNYGASPDGQITSTLLYPTTSGANRSLNENFGNTLSGGTYTLSVFAKSAGKNWLRFLHLNASAGNATTHFDLDNGTVGTTNIYTDVGVEDYGNGWYRCYATVVASGSTDIVYLMLTDTDNSNISTTNGTDGIEIWGAQIEQQSYATSYIKTEGSTVTREADEVSNGGQSQDFDSQIGQIMFQGKSHGNDGGEKYFSISDGSAANELLIGYGSTQNQLDFGFTQSSSSEYSDSFNVDDETDFNKVAFEYSSSGIKAWINGVLADETFSLTVPGANTFDTFNFSDGVGSNDYYGWTRKLFYLPNQTESMEELTAFTQDELISTFNLTVL